MFALLSGILIGTSYLTRVPWVYSPINQTISTSARSTAITFQANPGQAPPRRGTYQVGSEERSLTIVSSQGAKQRIRMTLRYPVDSQGRRIGSWQTVYGSAGLPALTFLHGAGTGYHTDFRDVAQDYSSVGFVTATIDKPMWDTTDISRDYPASAVAYSHVIDYLAALPGVNPHQVGMYATSEGAWISQIVERINKRVAFQVLLSPLVANPRQAMGYLVVQDMSILHAHPGYSALAERVDSMDGGITRIHNFDFRFEDPSSPRSYHLPTLVTYGSKDVLTAQVSGVTRIMELAHKNGNWNVTVRNYPVGNHVLRLGNEANGGTVLADHYEDDMVDWAVGTVLGLRQTSPRIAGAQLYQTIPLYNGVKGSKPLTICVLLTGFLSVLLLVVFAIFCLIVCLIKLVRVLRKDRRPVLGLNRRLRRIIVTNTIVSFVCVVLFALGLAQVVAGIVNLVWGAAPDYSSFAYWSWVVSQVMAFAVVVSMSSVFSGLAEIADKKTRQLMRKQPVSRVVADKNLGLVFFWMGIGTMFITLLFLACLGLFAF